MEYKCKHSSIEKVLIEPPRMAATNNSKKLA